MANKELIEQVKKIINATCYSSEDFQPVGLNNSNISKNNTSSLWCHKTFDSFYCWPKTQSGVLAIQPCTNAFITTSNKYGKVTKQCTANGTWLRRPDLENQLWTNLTECIGINFNDPRQKNESVDELYEIWVPIIKDMAYVGYATSILCLILSLFILLHIRRLYCERNKLHVQLFFSSLLRAATFVLKDILFVRGTALHNDATYDANGEPYYNYTWVCKLFISIRHYSIITNYMFMLMEGLYLHNLIFMNLFSENHGTSIYCLLGWVLPFWFVIPWVLLRIFLEDTRCWTQKNVKLIALLIDVPIGVTVVINFILFILIVRVLYLKIHFTSMTLRNNQKKYSKLLRSTLILIPLFGIPYFISLILSYYVNKSIILEILWIFFDQTFTAFQGFFAASVYCLFNSEVQIEIKRKYLAIRQDNELRRSRTISCNTQQFSLQTNDDNFENLNFIRTEDYQKQENVNQ